MSTVESNILPGSANGQRLKSHIIALAAHIVFRAALQMFSFDLSLPNVLLHLLQSPPLPLRADTAWHLYLRWPTLHQIPPVSSSGHSVSLFSLFFRRHRPWRGPASLLLYLFIVADVFVGHARQKLLKVLPLVALPALPVSLQVSVETFHFVLAFFNLCRYLWQHTGNYGYTRATTGAGALRGHNM